MSHLDCFQGKYRKWARDNMFKSKLPGDVKKQKAGVEQAIRTLDCDLREKKPTERAVVYTDKEFHRVAIEWLVATDQARLREIVSQ